ncbi:hypothetical protein K435DRAFT_815267 [Dendrothele bispora CBS 962.96]|uniref:Peptidase S9 prolyl oligopeptidase catalytic domain-containing protein n=1 Tax=Dendrothele bispora (strain CBS 962.96) TaxID=1314807 RepID=A0A4S8MZN6_DENBC|nr:hypothetical protein K435DRAFT_815267 [Dendrothele bispora CBS 962.96]
MVGAWTRICALCFGMVGASQVPLRLETSNDWSVELSTAWNVLGPFPIHAREQHYISPSFPLNLTKPIDYTATWPSSYADGGRVSWSTIISSSDGNLQVSFPNIRWKSLRDTEGWAALQHHAVLRTTLTVYPPKSLKDTSDTPNTPNLRVHLVQGSYFTVLPIENHTNISPRWYAGDIYAIERSLPHIVQLPVPPSLSSPTTYEIFVAGDYEIRLFGDPHVRGSEIPVQSIQLKVDIENAVPSVIRESSQDVVCDFVEGFAFGNALGVGVRSASGWWTVEGVEIAPESSGYFSLELARDTRIAPTQTRIIPLRISQFKPFYDTQLRFTLTLVSKTRTLVDIVLNIKQISQWTDSTFSTIQGTYFYAISMPTAFLAIPPQHENQGAPKPPILALHGAGVDIFGQSLWADSFSRMVHSWIVLPSGRTSWGLDWHGPSAADAWGSLDALVSIINDNPTWSKWSLSTNSPAIIMGHSNGGQGAWYLASRYPDRTLAVVPAAAYIKSQSYVPLTLSRSARYIDPALNAILESSLTPDNNDLFMSNLVNMPVLAIHGGEDENVPVWHSRELISILQTWDTNASAMFYEDPGKPHWYPTVLNNDRVQSFVDDVIESAESLKARSKSFTLTVAIPAESGSLHGWRIESLDIPGRIARLMIHSTDDGKVFVTSSNVRAFSVNLATFSLSSLSVDNARVDFPHDLGDTLYMKAVEPKIWKALNEPNRVQSSGRMQAIISTKAPISLVIPDEHHSQELSIALRIAHDLHTYHRLDCAIIQSSEVFTSGILNEGNVVVVGNGAAEQLRNTAFELKNPTPEQPLSVPGTGILFLHPHPMNKDAKMLLLQSTDAIGLEKAARLFPVRTGVAVPDWIIVGPDSDRMGAAGIFSAGVWSSGWTWNEPMSWKY